MKMHFGMYFTKKTPLRGHSCVTYEDGGGGGGGVGWGGVGYTDQRKLALRRSLGLTYEGWEQSTFQKNVLG